MLFIRKIVDIPELSKISCILTSGFILRLVNFSVIGTPQRLHTYMEKYKQQIFLGICTL